MGLCGSHLATTPINSTHAHTGYLQWDISDRSIGCEGKRWNWWRDRVKQNGNWNKKKKTKPWRVAGKRMKWWITTRSSFICSHTSNVVCLCIHSHANTHTHTVYSVALSRWDSDDSLSPVAHGTGDTHIHTHTHTYTHTHRRGEPIDGCNDWWEWDSYYDCSCITKDNPVQRTCDWTGVFGQGSCWQQAVVSFNWCEFFSVISWFICSYIQRSSLSACLVSLIQETAACGEWRTTRWSLKQTAQSSVTLVFVLHNNTRGQA